MEFVIAQHLAHQADISRVIFGETICREMRQGPIRPVFSSN